MAGTMSSTGVKAITFLEWVSATCRFSHNKEEEPTLTLDDI